MTRRRRADFHQGPERTLMLLKEAEYMAATGFTLHPTIAFRSGLGPYKARSPVSAFFLSCKFLHLRTSPRPQHPPPL